MMASQFPQIFNSDQHNGYSFISIWELKDDILQFDCP